MGYAVRVEPGALVAGARRLAVTAGELDGLASRVATLCAAAAGALGGDDLGDALAGTGRAAAGALAEGAGAVADLGRRTAAAGERYRLLEQVLTARLPAPLPGPGGTAAG